MPTTFITGGNKGLGHEVARRLLAQGHNVYIGARDQARGEAAAKKLGAKFVLIDVTDDASVAAAARQAKTAGVAIATARIIG